MGNVMRNKLSILCFGLIFTLVSACGGSGDSSGGGGTSGPSYSGSTTQAAIDENNAQALALAVNDGASSGDNQEQLGVLFENVFTNLQSQKSGISASAVTSGNCGGSATYPDNVSQQQSPITGTVSFYNYCLDGGESGLLVVSGYISFMAVVENDELVSMAISLDDVVLSFNGDTVTINASVAFSQQGTVFEITTDFEGSQGQTLRVENLSISGDTLNGITISSGRIYHPDNGYVDISTTETLQFDGCTNGHPHTGTLLLEGSGGSTAEVVYTSCTTYEICLDGNMVCTPYTWE